MGDARTCPACGAGDLEPAGSPSGRRAVCGHCGRCWEAGGRGPEVDSLGCPGCPRRGTCESCPTALVDALTRRHVLRDGEEVVIRPLLYGDRFELAAGYAGLSPASRESRFFEAPDELEHDDLEYLTNIDYRDHYACAALLPGRPVPNGVGVARYVREPGDPTVAEVAVTVVDAHQRRGIGSLLAHALGERAVEVGVRTFVSYVQWDNTVAIELLAAEGARVRPSEPGVARIEVDLPAPARVAEVPATYPARIVAVFAEWVRDLGHQFGPEPSGAGARGRLAPPRLQRLRRSR